MQVKRKTRVSNEQREATVEYAELERKMRRAVKQLKAMEARQQELIDILRPMFPAEEGVRNIMTAGLNYQLKYKPVERKVIDHDKVKAFFAQHKRVVPMRTINYELVHVVKLED